MAILNLLRTLSGSSLSAFGSKLCLIPQSKDILSLNLKCFSVSETPSISAELLLPNSCKKKYSMETRVITVLQGQNWGTQQNSEGGAADLAAEEAQVCVPFLRSDLSVNI